MSNEEKEYFDDLKERIKKSRYVFYADFSELEFLINIIEKQQKELEEKTTILLAGAEKVKQLEKGNRSLMESRIKWKNRYYKEKAKNKECISKDKIREKLKELEEQFKKYENEGLSGFVSKIDKGTRIEVLKELLEEN